jgi:Cu/Ag efflux protein CusF
VANKKAKEIRFMKNRIQKLGVIILLPAAALTFSACCSSSKCAPKTGGEAASLTAIQPGVAGGAMVETYTQTATVTGIDKAARNVTMVTEAGEKINFKAGPEVINFDQIEVGDRVSAALAEQVVVFVRKPGEPSDDGAAAVLVRAPLGEKPAALISNTQEVTAKVKSIDMEHQKATLVFPDGTSKTFKVRQDVDLTKYAAGDEVVFRTTEAMAISVEKP